MLHSQSDELRDGEAPEKKKKGPIVQYFILFDFIITVFFSTGNGAIHCVVELVLMNKQYSVICFILTIKNSPEPFLNIFTSNVL